MRADDPEPRFVDPLVSVQSCHPCSRAEGPFLIGSRTCIIAPTPSVGRSDKLKSLLSPKMRFFANGPNIPDELLEERDRGNVVFFCGAGVSYPADMPDFLGLARYVINELGTPSDHQLRIMLNMWFDKDAHPASRPPLDQIFNVLHQEYPPGEIDYLVAKRLRTKAGANTASHQMVLRLSTSAAGKPQIVTTNFDLLFERAAGRGLCYHVPPALPDLASGQPLNGLVYLHGRLGHNIKRGMGRHGFVISSADFGRAYLSDGWATRFVRDLLQNYIIVLLGYTANDPPVRYLLEGLNTRNHGNPATIYAFGQGTEEEVKEMWRDRGVSALAYPRSDQSHSVLWDSLAAWAERADDPLAWRDKIINLAQKGPRGLTPHERGQVASLMRTTAGAKLFADADPPPPGEWLCTFDRNVRYGDIVSSIGGLEPDLDPFDAHGLDDDPPRSSETGTKADKVGDDLIAMRLGDHRIAGRTRLAGIGHRQADPLPPRLFHLTSWFEKIAYEPVGSWWAAKYSTLHPALLDKIAWRVERGDDQISCLAKSIWILLLEKFRTAPEDDLDSAWYEVHRRIQVEGWTNSVLRAFDRSVAPHLKSEPPFGLRRTCPPEGDWSQISLRDIAEFSVVFPGPRGETVEIPNEILPKVYRIVQRNLEVAAGLLADIKTSYWKTSTFYPEDKPGERYIDNCDAYLFWFRDLLDEMSRLYPKKLRTDIALWPDERFFFNKLRLYAWASNTLYGGEEVGDALLSFSDNAFWEPTYRRELLHLLRSRWNDMQEGQRAHIEARLVAGRCKYDHEDESDFVQHRSSESAMIFGWLLGQGCALSDQTQNALPKLRGANPGWTPEWDQSADDANEGNGGGVSTNSDPSSIIDAPLNQIISLAQKYTKRSFAELIDYEPFQGLAELHPRRAVAALSHAARHGNYPIEFWRTIIQHWPDETKPRLRWIFGARLAQLPRDSIIELRHSLLQWFRQNLPDLATLDQTRAWNIFDVIVDRFIEGGADATASGLLGASFAGEPMRRSRRTLNHADNAPFGEITRMLLDILNANHSEKCEGIPTEIKSRLDRLFTAPGEGSDHAISVVARHIRLLDSLDSDWVQEHVLPWFRLDHPKSEPAWNAYLHDTDLLRPGLFSQIKPDFLDAIVSASNWQWDSGPINRLHEFLVLACFRELDDDAYVTFDEARFALQRTDDDGRAQSIRFLTRLVKETKQWRSFGKPFLDRAWPREARFRTEQISRRFVSLAQEAGDLFPEVVQTILPYLVPISGGHLHIHRLKEYNGEEATELPARFPDYTLALVDRIVPDSPRQAPYHLGAIVEMIGNAQPSLRQDIRWKRLHRITMQM